MSRKTFGGVRNTRSCHIRQMRYLLRIVFRRRFRDQHHFASWPLRCARSLWTGRSRTSRKTEMHSVTPVESARYEIRKKNRVMYPESGRAIASGRYFLVHRLTIRRTAADFGGRLTSFPSISKIASYTASTNVLRSIKSIARRASCMLNLPLQSGRRDGYWSFNVRFIRW